MGSQSGVGGQPEAVSQRGVAAGDWARGSLRWCADGRAAVVQRRLQQVLQGVKDLVLLKGEQWVRGHLEGIHAVLGILLSCWPSKPKGRPNGEPRSMQFHTVPL